MHVYAFDHIVLCVRDVDASLDFYRRVLRMSAREESPGKWSLHFGANKISLQNASDAPPLAEKTTPGSGNFCLLTDTEIGAVVDRLRANDVEIIEGPALKSGAVGGLMSVYFRDPDGNLVEVSNRLL